MEHPHSKSSYGRFLAMIGTSTVVMYGLTYLNSYAWDHVSFSETRAYMSLVMGAAMAVIMLSFMLGMYKNGRANAIIYVSSLLIFAGALWLVRSQRTVADVSYMNAMIPHHSIAILTSERAKIADHRVRKLADEIIKAQRKEIAEMKKLVEDIQKNGAQQSAAEFPKTYAPAEDQDSQQSISSDLAHSVRLVSQPSPADSPLQTKPL